LIQSAVDGIDLSDRMSKLTVDDNNNKNVGASNTLASIVIKPMSIDHKPDTPAEQERINKAGLDVIDDHGFSKIDFNDGLTNSSLGTSRGFGDFEFKNNKELVATAQAVIALPDIVVHKRSDADCFLVLACDGVFDFMTNEQVADFVTSQMESHVAAGDVFALARTADGLLQESLRLESTDNMSVVLVALRNMSRPQERDAVNKRLDFAD
jgi:serine/threonine protein phosphatase PrpC